MKDNCQNQVLRKADYGIGVPAARLYGWISLNRDRETMQNEEFGDSLHSPTDMQIGYDAPSEKSAFESTVIWIGKDSESESNEYLDECNTQQSGE